MGVTTSLDPDNFAVHPTPGLRDLTGLTSQTTHEGIEFLTKDKYVAAGLTIFKVVSLLVNAKFILYFRNGQLKSSNKFLNPINNVEVSSCYNDGPLDLDVSVWAGGGNRF